MDDEVITEKEFHMEHLGQIGTWDRYEIYDTQGVRVKYTDINNFTELKDFYILERDNNQVK